MADSTPADVTARRAVIALLCAAAGLRLAFLGSLPPAIFRDEAEKAYNAWCIAQTGRDLAGNLLPIFINVFGVTTSAIYQYAAVPFVAVLGLNEWSARLPAAFAGTATIAINYVYMTRTCGRLPALAATAFLAISPWHIVFSRWAQQGIFLPLLLSGAILAWQTWRSGGRHGLPMAAALLALAMYAYDVARLFVPMLMLGLAMSQWRLLVRQWRLAAVAAMVFLAVSGPTIYLMVNAPAAAQARFQAISIFQHGASPLSIAWVFMTNYLSHFSPSFLLLEGDKELRHSAGVGQVTLTELICALAGLWALARGHGRGDRIWIWWLVLAPVAASLTREGVPHALRSIVFIPVIQNLAGIGAAWFLERVPADRRPILARAVVLAALAAFFPFVSAYFGPYAGRSAVNWQYGVKQALDVTETADPSVPSIVFYNVTGAEYLVAFYRSVPPSAIRAGDPAWSRYDFPPFNSPLAAVCRAHTNPAALVMLPIFTPPCAASALPINAPRNERTVMVVYFNKSYGELAKRAAVHE